MDVVDLDLCVVLPVASLEAWVSADARTRAGWLAGDGVISPVEVGGSMAFVFRRERPRPRKPLVATEARRRINVVVSGDDQAAVQAAIDAPDTRELLAANARLPSGLLVIGGELAHADLGGGTPVAGPHRIVDLKPGDYRVEMRSVGAPGEPGFARVISYEPS